MPTFFSWTGQTPAVPSPHTIVEAFFCGLPELPYTLQKPGKYSLTFVRGAQTLGDVFRSFATVPATLIVTLRPNPNNCYDWSFNYEVHTDHDAAYVTEATKLLFGTPRRALREANERFNARLEEEVCCCLEYIRGFARQKPSPPAIP